MKVRSLSGAPDNQLFCAKLLSTFRKNLIECRADGLSIAQLSDCAFLWSEQIDLVAEAAISIFIKNTERGIFARGGMAYGQVIEPNKTKVSLGRFVCGEAVTRAVELEGVGKGARIFIDREIGGRMFKDISPRAFDGMVSSVDFSMIDEISWFSCPRQLESRSKKASRLKSLINMIGAYRYSPMFRWNAASAHGRVHLGATIERLSLAARSLAKEIEVDPPHFALTTSEIYQEAYDEDQYSSGRLESFVRTLKTLAA